MEKECVSGRNNGCYSEEIYENAQTLQENWLNTAKYHVSDETEARQNETVKNNYIFENQNDHMQQKITLNQSDSLFYGGNESIHDKLSIDITPESDLTSADPYDYVCDNLPDDGLIYSEILDDDYVEMDEQYIKPIDSKANSTERVSVYGYLHALKYVKTAIDKDSKAAEDADLCILQDTDSLSMAGRSNEFMNNLHSGNGVQNDICYMEKTESDQVNVTQYIEPIYKNDKVVRNHTDQFHNTVNLFDGDYENIDVIRHRNTIPKLKVLSESTAEVGNSNLQCSKDKIIEKGDKTLPYDSVFQDKVSAPFCISSVDCKSEDKNTSTCIQKASTRDTDLTDSADQFLAVKCEKIVDDKVEYLSTSKDANYSADVFKIEDNFGNASIHDMKMELDNSNAKPDVSARKQRDSNVRKDSGSNYIATEKASTEDIKQVSIIPQNDDKQIFEARSRSEREIKDPVGSKENPNEAFLEASTFQVSVVESPSEVGILSGKLYLQIAQDGIRLLTKYKTSGLYWPFCSIRRFGRQKNKACFYIEAGRRCESGPGYFVFKSERFYEQIYEKALTLSKTK